MKPKLMPCSIQSHGRNRAAAAILLASLPLACSQADDIVPQTTPDVRSGALTIADKPENPGGPEDGSSAASKSMAAQAPLLAAATAIKTLGDAAESGYAGIALDVERGTVSVAWKGRLPASVVEEVRRREGQGVSIAITRASFSRTELSAAARRVMTASQDGRTSVHTAGPLPDGSAIVVGSDEPVDIGSIEALSAPIPVRVEQSSRIVQTSRSDDFSPYWGGATIMPAGGSARCTTGFAVGNFSLFGEISRGVLTVNHCAPGGNRAFFDGGGGQTDWVGIAGPGSTWTDSLYIQTFSPVSTSSPRFYDGALNAGMFSKPVVGQASNFAGQLVCNTGAATGVHCDLKVLSVGNFATLSPSGVIGATGTLVSDVVIADQLQGTTAVGPGDSGAPTFVLAWPDPNRTLAVGQTIGRQLGFPATCPVAGQVDCSSRVAYVDIGAILQEHGLRLLTAP